MEKQKIWMAVVILVVIVGLVLGVDAFRRSRALSQQAEAVAGSVPIYYQGELIANLTPQDVETLEKSEFKDEEGGKIQQGWLLADILQLYIAPGDLQEDTQITVSSSSRGKSVTLTWAEVQDPDHMVMFDLSGRGTLKLVSQMEKLNTREEWIQDTDKIEVE